jgi:LuxR family maltose regulon positive regulatory protein
LRGRGQLVDITIEELPLSADETKELIEQELPGKLGAEEHQLLHERTEGWVTGLHLAALSLRGHPHPKRLVKEFAGNDRHIGDYLLTEVIQQQPEDLRTFLRATSILQRFNAPLCDAVTEREDSAELLSLIEHNQLFLIPLDNRGEWYRYHHLFTDVLKKDLHRFEPAGVPELHGRAIHWHAHHDFPLEAVQHALASGDTSLAADVVAAHAVPVAFQGYGETAQGWFDVLGEELCLADPRLCLARALVAAGARVQEMERWAHFAEAATRKPELSDQLACVTQVGVGLLRWSSRYYAGDVDTALGCAQRVLQLLADDPAPWHANAQLALGFCLYRKRRFREAQTALSQACTLAEEGHDDLTATAAYGTQAVIAAAGDRHRDAERLAARAEHYGHQHAASEHFYAWSCHFARG